MTLRLMTNEQKLEVIEKVIARYGNAERYSETVQTLKAIATDLRARLDLPRSEALGELERAMAGVKASQTGLGYEERNMITVAYVVIKKWDFIRQALEAFGKEIAE